MNYEHLGIDKLSLFWPEGTSPRTLTLHTVINGSDIRNIEKEQSTI
jgi:hypothetical protein